MNVSVWPELADDAETLARLHDREPDAATLAALAEVGFPDNLALLPPDDAARLSWDAMRAAMHEISAVPSAPTFAELEALAVDYAAIYLTGAYNASPCESFWLDEDHLLCQQPMWQLREIYQAAGLAAADWRKRPDDHLVLQLLYLAHMLRHAKTTDLATMLDAHLLRWLPDFATRVAARAEQPYLAALAALTLAWCRALRAALVSTA